MSITRSYNKHTDTYYAYETNYVWDEQLKKKVQKKRCIGQYDPETGEVIPNGKVGRPGRQKPQKTQHANTSNEKSREYFKNLPHISSRLEKVEDTLQELLGEIASIKSEISRLSEGG